MTIQLLLQIISGFLPNATIGEDNDGQIIIYTNLKEVPVHDLTGEETGDMVLIDMGDL